MFTWHVVLLVILKKCSLGIVIRMVNLKCIFYYKNKSARLSHWPFFKSYFKEACFFKGIMFSKCYYIFVLLWFWTCLSVYCTQYSFCVHIQLLLVYLCTQYIQLQTGLSVYIIHIASTGQYKYYVHSSLGHGVQKSLTYMSLQGLPP